MIQIDQSQKLAAYAKSTTSADKMVVSSLFGTPEAAAARMLDVITLSGVASGRKLPSRFALGEDALLHLNNFHKRRLADVEGELYFLAHLPGLMMSRLERLVGRRRLSRCT